VAAPTSPARPSPGSGRPHFPADPVTGRPARLQGL